MNMPSKGFLENILASFSNSSESGRYTIEEGGIRYLDGSSLDRPAAIPRRTFLYVLVVAAIAAIIGIALAINVLGSTLHAAERAAASVEENLGREITLDMPSITSFAGMDAASVKSSVESLGLNAYTVSDEDDLAAGTLDIVKLPSDVSIEEGAMYYAQGVGNLDAPDAALLLNGMWRLQLETANGFDLVIRYADFDSGNIDDAIENAITTQGFDTSTATQLDVDEAGNTFRSGTLDANGTSYNWRVSAISLDSVYDIAGLPDTAIYVGVRITAA